jgi:hypothetical protein
MNMKKKRPAGTGDSLLLQRWTDTLRMGICLATLNSSLNSGQKPLEEKN